MKFTTLLVATIIATTSFVSASALACNCLLFGFNEIPVGDDGIIPSNALGIPWLTNYEYDNLVDQIRVEQIDGETSARVGFTLENLEANVFIIRPTTWREGRKYKVHTEIRFEEPVPGTEEIIRDVQVEVGPATDPSIVPRIQAEPAVRGIFALSNEAFCTNDSDVMAAEIQMTNLPAGAAGFFFSTIVDGEVWAPKANDCRPNLPGASWVAPGKDRLVTICSGYDADANLAPGSHTVKMEARLPGTEIVYTTETITVELLCPGAVIPDLADAGTDIGSEDAGELDAGADTAGTATEGSGGTSGGCQSTQGSNATALLFLLGLFGLRRRDSKT